MGKVFCYLLFSHIVLNILFEFFTEIALGVFLQVKLTGVALQLNVILPIGKLK